MVQTEGPSALLKGWVPNYIRQGPQTLIIFVVMEQLYRVIGTENF